VDECKAPGREDDNDPTPSLLKSESESLLLSSPPPSLWKNFQSRRLNMTGDEGVDCEGRRLYLRSGCGGRGNGAPRRGVALLFSRVREAAAAVEFVPCGSVGG
jgi:hypothetical protein